MGSNYHHKNLRDALLDAGMRIIGRDGLKALSLRAVAREAGVSHMAPYRHFKDKTELTAGITRRGYEIFNRSLADAVDRAENAQQKLDALTAAYVRFALDREDYYRLIFGESIAKCDYSDDLYEESMTSFTLLKELLCSVQPCRNPTEEAFVAWSTLHGTVMLVLDRKTPREFGQPGAQWILSVLKVS